MSDEPVDTAGDGDHGASGSPRQAEPPDGSRQPRLPFPVVGVGASAGGLEAYTEFLDASPPDTGAAFVLIQHLSPDRESLVAEILARHTAMPVLQVEDGQPVRPNHVYVIRPGHTLTLRDGRLRLGEPVSAPVHRRPVDDFFRSLADEQQQRAVAVVFSGMGSNGTAGAEVVKAVGGLVIAQEPQSAKFPSMPRSLIDANLADFVLRPAEVPAAVVRYARHPYAAAPPTAAVAPSDAQAVAEILAVLGARTKYDFDGYRTPTLVRRIQRRMGLNQVERMADYARGLRQSAAEVTALADDLLIHVTGFFRDPEAWDVLREKVIDPLVAERPAGEPIRAWVTACATGEEAYTLAMLLVEAAEARNKAFDVKIFATDMADRALGHARAGVFPGGIEGEVTPDRLDRFFDRDDSMYRVKKELRDLVVFAPQNVLHDPPFSRIDIVTCRNLLIYLEPDVQKRVVALLHFGLREGGALLLGSSESVGGDGEFEVIDKRHRLFRRVGPTRHGQLEFPLPVALRRPGRADAGPPLPRPTPGQLAHRALLDHHTPPAVVIDRQAQIVYYHGDTGRFLDQPRGEPTRDLLTLANEQIRGAVRTAVHRAADTDRPAHVRDGRIDTPAGRRRVEVSALPLDPRAGQTLYLVSFHESAESPAAAPAGGVPADDTGLADELRRVRDELQSTLEEMQTGHEEMRASNEEVTSINEELQSTNEELETSKEELQSLNEELATSNAQLQAKMEELEATTNDLTSLLSSTDIAVVFLDPRFRIRRFTPAVQNLFDLIPSDVGRPLADMRRKFADPDLLGDAAAVLDRLVPVEREVRGDGGRLYVRRALPYRTADNRIDGVVLTFVDVTRRRAAEDALGASEERTRVAVAAAALGSFVWHPADDRGEPDGRMRDLFGLPPDAPLSPSALAAQVHPADRGRYAAAVARALDPAGTGELREEVRVVHPDGDGRWLAITARAEFAGDPRRAVRMAGVAADVTDRKAAEAALRDSEARYRALATNLPNGASFVVGHDLRYQLAAGDALALAGMTPADLEGRTVAEANGPELAAEYEPQFRRVLAGGTFRSEHAARGRHYVTHGLPMRDAGGAVVAALAVSYDITERVLAEAALRQARDDLEGRVRSRTAELAEAVAELRAEADERGQAEAERRSLLARLDAAQEAERTRISRELHDTLGQYLAALAIGLNTLRDGHAAGHPGRAAVDRLAALTDEAGREVHRLAVELRPTALDDLGLRAAVRAHVEGWSARTGVAAEFTARGVDDEHFPGPVATAVYRAVQESLTNVLKHAAATRVGVILERRPRELLAIVEDDGRGCDPDAAPAPRVGGGLGLVGMRERVALAGGTVQIESSPGAGTTVYVRVPVPEPEADRG